MKSKNLFAVLDSPTGVCASSAGTVGRASRAIAENPDSFRDDFLVWLESNWPIWDRFCTETESILSMGRQHYSARTIVEYIRHETALSENTGSASSVALGQVFKINNSYVPDMGRLFGLMNHSHKDFFECRQMIKPLVRKVIRGKYKSHVLKEPPGPERSSVDGLEPHSTPPNTPAPLP